MKQLAILLLIFFLSPAAFAQKKYIPDSDVEYYKENGIIAIRQISTGKRLAANIKLDFVTEVYHGLIGFKQNEHYGLVNIYGKVVIPAIYDKIEEEDYTAYQFLGNYIGLSKGGKLTVLDTLGKTLVPLGDWQFVDEIEYGLIVVYQNDKIGLFKNGKQVLPCLYDAEPSYSSLSFDSEQNIDVTTIRLNDSIGLVDKNGKIILATQFDDISQLYNQYWIARKNGVSSIYDIHGKFLLQTDLTNITEIYGDYILGYKSRNFGIINFKGKEVYPFELDEFAYPVFNNAIFAKKANNWGIIDFEHPEKAQFIYQSTYAPVWNRNKLAIFKKNGFYGIINQKGEEVVPFDLTTNEYELNFYRSNVVVERNNKQGILVEDGSFKIPCIYDSILYVDYFPCHVINNGKMGIIDEKGTVLTPLQYDEIGWALLDKTHLVMNQNKVGVYRIGDKELIPTKYDSIFTYNNYYVVVLNGKQGLIDAEGKQIIPCQFSSVVAMRDVNVVVQTNNILTQYNIETGQLETLKPDSICRFETTSLVNFGGRMIESQNNPSTLTFGDGIWLFMENKTQAIISEQFYQMGQFDTQNRIVASPKGKDYMYAYNQRGEAIQPRFYVTPKDLLFQILFTESKDSIRYFMKKNGLLNNVPEEKEDEYINEHYIVKFEQDYIYDEVGDPIDVYFLSVLDRASFFDLNSPFPSEPNYVYDFFEEYERIGKPNETGWMWALPKKMQQNEWYDSGSYPELKTCVLVNQLGERKEKVNYIPKESKPFLELVALGEVDTSDLQYLLPFLDSLKKHFQFPFVSSAEAQARMLFDSILTRTLVLESYTDYGETSYETHLFFYKRNGLQLFQVAPPKEVVYEFYPVNFNLVKGAEQLNEPDFITRMDWNKQVGYAFGKEHFFLFPKMYNESDPKAELSYMNELSNRISESADSVLKESLNHLSSHFELIKKGIAREVYSYNRFEEEKLNDFPMEDLSLYAYTSNVGLIVENELVVDPVYDFAMVDYEKNGVVSGFILATKTNKVVRYDPIKKQVSNLKSLRFLVNTGREIILVNPKSQLMNCYPISIENEESVYNLWVPTIKAKNIKAFYYIGNTSDFPLLNSYGEDSVIYEPDGLILFVYPPADTFMFNPSLPYNVSKGFNLYELADGSFYFFDGAKAEGLKISDEVRYRDLPLNDAWYRPFSISKKETGYQLSLGDNSLTIPFKTYKALLKQTPKSNFYGGVVIDGVYYSYQTLKPFPEQHDIIIRTSPDNYTIGNKKLLENVVLGYDNTIISREKL
ncbi:MAG: WG repeat-containing protein [Fluviicola sp.]|nr:WG repeat-containing protein [Fluviicola sp.]